MVVFVPVIFLSGSTLSLCYGVIIGSCLIIYNVCEDNCHTCISPDFNQTL